MRVINYKHMRIWDVPTSTLCRQHLLGEHRELHAIWSVITQGKKGYAHHPETERWREALFGLWYRHEDQKEEMAKRGYKHHSELVSGREELKRYCVGTYIKPPKINTLQEQRQILRDKGCECGVF